MKTTGKLTVSATGDSLMIAPFPEDYARDLAEIREFLAESDVRLTNLETNIAPFGDFNSAFSGGTWLNTEPDTFEHLLGYGFNYVLVMVHCHEVDNTVSSEVPALLKELTHACVDAGACAIFGGGCHQLRPLEIYNGAPIFYSLGDFIYQGMRVKYLPADFMEKYGVADNATAWEGLMARSKGGKIGLQAGVENFLTVLPRVRFENGKMVSLEMLPVDLAFNRRDDRNGLPRRARGATARDIFERLSKLSAPFGTTLRLERGMIKAI